MDGTPCWVRTGAIGKQFHANLSNLGKLEGFFQDLNQISCLSFMKLFYFSSVWTRVLLQFNCISWFFYLSRLQPIHDASCNPLPWASFTCKPKSLQPKLVAVMSPESSVQLVNGNVWVAELGIKLCSCAGHWAVWCDAHLSLQYMKLSWCEVVACS